jgi:hypothetical protein|nr:MAG TPA: hypothetical protein [Caudoviricetes sp.]
MAKQTKKESIEEVVNNEITEVVDKVTTPEDTEKENESTNPNPEPEPEQPEEGNGTENVKTEPTNPEPATEPEQPEQSAESENIEERTELPEGDLPKEIYESLAKCNWFNHLNIGKFLEDKYETTKENLAFFFEDYKSGNYLSSQEEYDVFRKLNEYFQ